MLFVTLPTSKLPVPMLNSGWKLFLRSTRHAVAVVFDPSISAGTRSRMVSLSSFTVNLYNLMFFDFHWFGEKPPDELFSLQANIAIGPTPWFGMPVVLIE